MASDLRLGLAEELQQYIQINSLRDLPVLQQLREVTQTMVGGHMQIAPEQGQLLQVLLQSIQAKRVLEIGTFTGYSALVMALALPQDGYLLTCDVSTEAPAIAKEFWQKAGIANKIELKIAPALTTLAELVANKTQPFDFVFIDADKMNNFNYYEYALQLTRPGAMITIDNVLLNGTVANEHEQTERVLATRKLNAFIAQDARVNACIVPIADGLTIAVKR